MRNTCTQIIKQLDKFASAFSTIDTLDKMIQAVESILEDTFNVEYTGLYLYDPSEERLKLLYAKGFSQQEIVVAEQSAMERHPGLVFQSGKMIYISDTLLDENALTKSSERSFEVRSRLYLPVMNGDTVVGAFGIVDSKPNAYETEDIAALSFICNMAGALYGKIINQNELRKMALIARETGNAVVITNKAGEIEWINKAFTQITGFKFEEIKGKIPGEFLQGEETDQKTVALLSEAIKKEKALEVDIINYSKSHKKYWVKLQIQPVFNSSGQLENFISIQKEITKEKEQYDALQIANLRFRSLISSIQAGVMVENEQRKVVLVNQHFCNLFSIPLQPDQLIGMNCQDAADAAKELFIDPDTFIKDISNTLALRQIVTNFELQMADGTYLERDYIPIEDPEKKNQGILWVYRNITQRKKNERDLKRQSQILSGTAKAMNYLLTLDNHDIAINQALEAIGYATGVDRVYLFEKSENLTSGEVFLSQRSEWTAEGVTSQVDNPELQNMPFSEEFPRWYKLLSKGETLVGLVRDFPEKERQFLESQQIISIIVVPVFVNDQFWGTVGFDDCKFGIQWSSNELSILKALAGSIGGSISRRIIENELINSRYIAENATKSKSDFLATMSHEIRTPMNGVIGMTSLLLQTPMTADQRDYTETIKISGELLLDLINDILDFSKIESGKMTLEEYTFDLRLAIEDVFDLMGTAAAQKKLRLYFQVDPAIPQKITGDLTRLRQILVNLTGNAIKFTPDGEIVISVIQIEKQGNDATLEFSVKDSGVGIPEEKINRLFKPFSQVDASTTRKYGGTGLGLAICAKLVKLMNGDIRVKSAINSGSEFIFTIKTVYQPIEENLESLSSDQKNLNGKKILIVDSHPTSSTILCDLFKNLGMNSFSVDSAKMTLNFIKERKDVDLIVIDNSLTDMNCNALATEIKKIKEYVNIPLILINNPTLTDNSSATYNNFHVRINKPLKQSQLISYVVNLLSDINSPQIQSIIQPKQLQKINEIYPLNILVAEDNAINQKLILRLFEMLGYQIYVAANGFEVLDALNRMKIDIVFMDIQMPEMDGFEATKQIIAEWGNQKPLIVAMTANALNSDKEKCLEAGMDDYISKPLTIDQVKIGIEKWTQLIKVIGK
jgi:PAS domain S-box-containing protein